MKLNLILGIGLAAMVLTSCDDGPKGEYNPSTTVNYQFAMDAVDFNDAGYWNQVYNTGYDNIGWNPDLLTTHHASADEYDGVVYKSWNGFCPSRSTDTGDYSGRDWTENQWSAITGTGAGDSDYLVACWPVDEKSTLNPAVAIAAYSNTVFYPKSVYITNTTWGYYAMLFGTDFNRAFTDEDWCKVTITGMYGYAPTGKVDVYLARDGNILDTWQPVDLSSLGLCNVLVFTMSSSDTGQWGMNNPAYFAMDNLTLIQ